MKKLVSLLLAAVMLFGFAACSQAKQTVLVISGAEIDSEIFTYYIDKVISRPGDYGLAENPDKEDAKNAAIEQCKEYVAANTEFKNRGLSLSVSDKVGISETVNNLWIRFENHYDEIGVSKQTLTKVYTSQAYSDAIFASIYDKGTDNAEAEAVIQDYFYRSYVSFRAVCEYFNYADGTPISQKDKSELLAKFNGIAAAQISSADEFSLAVQNLGYSASASVLLKKGSDGYPAGFSEKVYELQDNDVAVIIYDDCVFTVMKENLKEKGEGVYAEYRSACINDLYSDDAGAEFEEIIGSYTVEEKSGKINSIVKDFT